MITETVDDGTDGITDEIAGCGNELGTDETVTVGTLDGMLETETQTDGEYDDTGTATT
jgi:hypothetical protein